MNVRIELVKDFHSTMTEWWKLHKWPIIPIEVLPENVFILNKDDVDCYFCTLYKTDSDFGVVAWPTSNKNASRDSNDISFLFEEIEKYSKTVGIKLLFTTSGTKRIEESLIDSGYFLGDKEVNQYLRWVKQ